MSWNPISLLYGYATAAWIVLAVTGLIAFLFLVKSRHRLKGWLKAVAQGLGSSGGAGAQAGAGETGGQLGEQLTLVLQREGEIIEQLDRLNQGVTQLIKQGGEHHDRAQLERIALHDSLKEFALKFEQAQGNWQNVLACLLQRQVDGINEIAENTTNITTPEPPSKLPQLEQPKPPAEESREQIITPSRTTVQLKSGEARPSPAPTPAPKPSTPPPASPPPSPEDGASQPAPSPPPRGREAPDVDAVLEREEEELRKFISDKDALIRDPTIGRSGIEDLVKETPFNVYVPAKTVFIIAPRSLRPRSRGRAYVFPGEMLVPPYRNWFNTEGKQLNINVRVTSQPAIVIYQGGDDWDVDNKGSFHQA